MAKSKKTTLVKLVPEAAKKNGEKVKFYYTKKKNSKMAEKLKLKKFNPTGINPETGKLGVYEMFVEAKINAWTDDEAVLAAQLSGGGL